MNKITEVPLYFKVSDGGWVAEKGLLGGSGPLASVMFYQDNGFMGIDTITVGIDLDKAILSAGYKHPFIANMDRGIIRAITDKMNQARRDRWFSENHLKTKVNEPITDDSVDTSKYAVDCFPTYEDHSGDLTGSRHEMVCIKPSHLKAEEDLRIMTTDRDGLRNLLELRTLDTLHLKNQVKDLERKVEQASLGVEAEMDERFIMGWESALDKMERVMDSAAIGRFIRKARDDADRMRWGLRRINPKSNRVTAKVRGKLLLPKEPIRNTYANYIPDATVSQIQYLEDKPKVYVPTSMPDITPEVIRECQEESDRLRHEITIEVKKLSHSDPNCFD